jgi:hypothetical protein
MGYFRPDNTSAAPVEKRRKDCFLAQNVPWRKVICAKAAPRLRQEHKPHISCVNANHGTNLPNHHCPSSEKMTIFKIKIHGWRRFF